MSDDEKDIESDSDTDAAISAPAEKEPEEKDSEQQPEGDYYDEPEEDEEEDTKKPSFDFRKNWKPLAISFGVFVVFVLIIMSAMHKPKGTVMYGVCKTFIEMQVTYPPTLEFREVEQYPRAVRIYYTFMDPFGTQKSEFIECAFEMVPGKGAQVQAILLNRKEIDAETIRKFNETVAAIVAGEPDLILPERLTGALEDLKR